MTENRADEKWYFRISALVIAVLCVGPVALPLVWFNPRFSRRAKIAITLAVAAFTYLLGVVFTASMKSIVDYYKLLSL